jgi:4-diphosphocytidyl-2-C-methyl-D-erythritol kinase
LEVLGKRTDGYHELISVMQSVTLWDTLQFKSSSAVTLTCSDITLGVAGNLVMEAIELVQSKYHVAAGCSVHLEKRIPTAAGLGGGSSDAAAALVSLARLWNLQVDCSALIDLAAELGSDVPFFLCGGRALLEGRGERVTSLPSGGRSWYLLVKPPFRVPTSSVFAALPSSSWTNGSDTVAVAQQTRTHGDVQFGVNGLQDTVFRLYPDTRRCFELVRSLAPDRTILAGSGPTVVAGFLTQQEALDAAVTLPRDNLWAHIACDYQPPDWQTPCA